MESNRESLSPEMSKNSGDGGVTVIDTPANPSLGAADTDPYVRAMDKLVTRFFRWLYPDQRKGYRHAFPPIVAHLGAVETSHAYRVADISASGFYMLTIERWLPGTEMPVTLARIDGEGDQSKGTITMLSRVVRSGPDGVGFSFEVVDREEAVAGSTKSGRWNPGAEAWASQKDLERFLEGMNLSEPDAPELERAS